MATTTSRISLDPSPSLIDLPHVLPNPHARVPDLPPVTHPQVRRVSSDSQAPGRASPSPRITRRTPVPFLLEAFPAPPSHIPGTPTTGSPNGFANSPSLLASATSWLASTPACSAAAASVVSPSNPSAMSPCSPQPTVTSLAPNNPPPSSPPTGPLPPIPGPSSITPDLCTTHRALQTAARSASLATSVTESHWSHSRTEQRPRLSVDVNEQGRGRRRQGSLSSLRNPIYPVGEQSEAIVEEPAAEYCPCPSLPSAAPPSAPFFGSIAERKSHDQSRGDSPDILRSSLSRVVTATRPVDPGSKLYVEDSIASVDMSDLNALKSDNEGEVDDHASRPFPRFPPLPRSQPQSPTDAPSAPSCVHAPRKPRESSACSMQVSSAPENVDARHRAMSPEITQMITATPRARKRSTPSCSRDPSCTRNRKESGKKGSVPPVPASCHTIKTALHVRKTTRRSGNDEATCAAGEGEGNESDSSLDLHTPLPQLMLRHGMLSPNSKLLPRHETDRTRLSMMSSLSSSSRVSDGSNLSLMSTMSISSKHPKDTRDTPQRRSRHRDGRLLKGGIGLTTGLGWSDSEDEDAPSPLTRRLSTLALSRRASSSSVASSHSNSPHPLSRSISHNLLREVDERELGYSTYSSSATRSLPSRSKPVSRVGSARSAGSSFGRYSSYSTSSAGHRARAGSASESIVLPDNAASADGLMPGIREHDDGVTPTRAAFERSSLGSLNGGSGADPHTPSSTASSASLSFPVTPESSDTPPLQPTFNQDKTLPPLPPGSRGKYPSSLGLRSQPGGLQRPRTYSNASSVSNSSMRGVPSADVKTRSASPASTPRQSVAERSSKTSIPAGSLRPPFTGTPRPSLTIPRSPLPPHVATSGLPRPTSPSLSPCTDSGSGCPPRPLRLAELNQAPSKALQPGEQSPRPGQVLTYNRNVHDQLKLRALSLNTGVGRAPGPAVSPSGTQTLFISSVTAGSSPNSALATPVTALSQSPLPSPSPGGESPRPKPRIGTGMAYRNNLSVGSVATSRIRVPSTVAR